MLTKVVCAGCGHEAGAEPFPFRCPRAGDGGDHVMTRVLDTSSARWPAGDEPNPFLRYRALLHSYQLARARGLSDREYVELVQRLDRQVAEVDGRGFVVTPFSRAEGLSSALGFSAAGGAFVKDETGNVSGSHKARHLMGLLILLEVAERAGLADVGRRSELAIASCGNAALAAAVVAKAGGRTLEVFVPTSANPAVLERLRGLGARLTVCPREEGVKGDPTYLRLQRAVREGALPFTCQGSDNGLTLEGGLTLGYELASELRREGASLDRLFIQVGGGALASGCVQALAEARSLGAVGRTPRLHAVQTRGGHPLKRAYDLVAARILARLGLDAGLAGTAEGAERLRGAALLDEELRYAAAHRAGFMWPWEEEPRSVAHGILDDETYDWLAVVRGMLESGGYPVVVSEERLEEANALGRAQTGVEVDHTGSSGLAGLLELRSAGEVRADEKAAVLFTGRKRGQATFSS